MSYGAVMQPGLIRPQQPMPAPGQLVNYGTHRTDQSMQFSMNNDDYQVWLLWVYTYAYHYFLMPIVSEYTPVDVTSTHRVRFTTDIQYTKRGDDWITVSVGVEILQGDTEDPLASTTREYDYILAGSASSPSLDVIDAGTASNPSTDTITGSLYAYSLE